MSKAIAKARKVHCRIKPIAWRRYQVTTPEGKVYFVTFDLQAGRKLAACSCEAGMRGMFCYHLAGAAQAHLMIARMREASEPLFEPTPAAPVRAPRDPFANFDQPKPTPSLTPLLDERRAQRGEDGKPSWRMTTAIRGIAAIKGIDVEGMCQGLYGCSVKDLSRRAASAFIDDLKAANPGAPAVSVTTQPIGEEGAPLRSLKVSVLLPEVIQRQLGGQL